MSVLMRLFDSNEASLDRRLAAAQIPEGSIVARFTYWYTSRPPVIEAVVMAPASEE